MSTRSQNAVADQQQILDEIRSLRSEVQALSANRLRPVLSDPAPARKEMKISLDRSLGERKPFVLRVQGLFDVEVKLSAMRATIFLTLLLDLHCRSEGGGENPDPMQRMIDIYRELDGATTTREQIAELIRVGLYRFELALLEERTFCSDSISLTFNPKRLRLEIAKDSALSSISDLSVSLAASDHKILAIIDRFSGISPLGRIRSQGSLYISSGEQGWDRLFLEYFDHSQPVRNTSLFYRPALPTYSDELLTFIKAPAATFKRKQVMLKGYRNGRVAFDELLTRQTLWDMITLLPSGEFKLYPAGVSAAMVAGHLKEIISQLETCPGYQLSLTQAAFPFIVGVVQIGAAPQSESFSMFYRIPALPRLEEATCFVLRDPFVSESVLTRVIGSVRSHPSTTTKRSEVIEEVKNVLGYLEANGPMGV